MESKIENFEQQYPQFFQKSNLNNETVKYFGKTAKAFSKETLQQIINQEKQTVTDKKAMFLISKNYVVRYFAKSSTSPSTIYFYEPGTSYNISNEGMEVLKTVNFDITYHSSGGNNDNEEEAKIQKFNIYKWFLQYANGSFRMTSDPMKAIFFEDELTSQCYINLSKGFLHKQRKPFKSFEPKVQAQTHRILNHVKRVWCSNNESQYEYVLNWLACALTGHKRHTALFLKSGEGTGKSIVVEFIIKYVIGEALGLITSRAQQLLGFNSMLLERILVCLEELPSGSKNEWHSLSDVLKDLITGGKLSIEKKYEDMIQIVNYISLIIITNNDNTIKFGKDVRRYFMADISHDYVGNTNYFDELSAACNCALTGQAMFMFMLEHYEKIKDTFQENIIPETLAKLEMKERNSSELLTFIKRNYIKMGTGIDDKEHKTGRMRMNQLRQEFNRQRSTHMTAKAFAQALRQDLPIVKLIPYGKNKELFIQKISFQTLKQYFEQKGFWNDMYDKAESRIDIIEDECVDLLDDWLDKMKEMKLVSDLKMQHIQDQQRLFETCVSEQGHRIEKPKKDAWSNDDDLGEDFGCITFD